MQGASVRGLSPQGRNAHFHPQGGKGSAVVLRTVAAEAGPQGVVPRFRMTCPPDDVEPEICLYRGRTVGILRKYLRMSVELGRVPSLLGREFFRAKVTSYRMNTFEDAVIMAYDIDRCLEKLDGFAQQLIARVVLQEYTHDEAASALGCERKTVTRNLPAALDRLSAMFLKCGILEKM